MSRFSHISREIKRRLGVERVICRSAGRNFFDSDFTVTIRDHEDGITCYGYTDQEDIESQIELLQREWDYYLNDKSRTSA